MIKNLLVVAVLVVVMGCSYEEPITFLRLQEVKVNGIKNGELLLSTRALFNNPNGAGGRIKKVNIYVLHRRDTLAIVHETNKLKISPNANFSLPLSLRISIDKLQSGLLSNLSSLLQSRTVKLDFVGDIKVSSWGVSQKIPVSYSEKVKF